MKSRKSSDILNLGRPPSRLAARDDFRTMLLHRLSWLFHPTQQGLRALEDRRVYAIGDIHGCSDLLSSLLLAIQEATSQDQIPPLLIFLGDYVDRGPESRQVIDCLIDLGSQGVNARFLCGNHEEAMLGFLTDFQAGMAWPDYGGRETMASYGVAAPDDRTDIEGWRRSWRDFQDAMPAAHLRFLRSLEDQIELGDLLFVHAGVDPTRPLHRQRPRDLRWIREPFLSDSRRLERVVVHGHTPVERPFVDRRRIAVDTWAYQRGVLTAVELSSGQVGFLQASRQGQRIHTGRVSSGKSPAENARLPKS